MACALTIKPLTTLEELELAAQLEHKIWKFSTHPILTLTLIKNGGLVLAAWDRERLVAFTLGFPGHIRGFTYFCSHMLGVDKDYRDRNLGERLKREQAIWAAKKGYRLLTWTYDPLETRNGNLNVRKLGAVASQYKANYYGDLQDEMNQALPTDRFLVEWWPDCDHVRERDYLANYRDQARPLYATKSTANGLLEPRPWDQTGIDSDPDGWWLAVPRDFQGVKRASMDLALQWRLHTRTAFTELFAADYLVADLMVDDLTCYYLLLKRRCLRLPQRSLFESN